MGQRLCQTVLVLAIGGVWLLNMARADFPAAPTDRPYQAQWIWCQVESPEPFQFARFRKTIDVASRPESATAYITADTFYRLWINGQLVMHGPARSSRGKATVDAVDVGRHLTPGRNTLMIEVFHGVCPFEALAQAPGLLCELGAEFGGQTAILAATDANWEAAEITAWSRKSLKFNYQRGWTEQFDARRTLEEKSQPAIVLGKVGTAPWLKVEPRDIPLPAPLVEVRPTAVVAVQRGDGYAAEFHGPETRIEPKAEWDERSAWFRRLHTEHLTADPAATKNPQGLTKAGQGDAILQGEGAGVSYDLGRGYVGFVGFEVTGQAGQVIEVVWNDRLADGAVRPCAQTGRNALQFTLRDGRQSFLAFMPQFARFLRISQRGPGEVTVHRLAFTEFRFAAEPKGDFVCSDEELNRIYQANVSLTAFLGKTWAPRGKTPKAEVTGGRGGVAALSAISKRGHLLFALYEKRIASDEVIHFLAQMLHHHRGRHLVVLMDNAPPHTSKKTLTFIDSQPRLHVFNFPSYSPDWNPDEKVWNHLKHQELKSHKAKTKAELKELTERKLNGMANDPHLVRGLFFRCCVADLFG